MYLAEGIQLKETYKSNQNVLVVGSPGVGKTRGHVIPGLMSGNCSMVVLDPKGEIYSMTHEMMKHRGFDVVCIDFDNPFNTEVFYNPLVHIRDNKYMGEDIIKVTSALTRNYKEHSVDPFWADAAQLLGNSLIGYLVEECNEEDRTLESVMKLLRQISSKDQESVLDVLMSDLEQRNPKSFAVEQYQLFKTSSCSEKTEASIIISLVCTFTECMSQGMKYLTHKNTLDFEKLGERRTVLYIKSSDTDRSKDKIIEMLFHQLFDELCHIADGKKNHCLDMHVHFYLDDFGTNLYIKGFDSYISGMRSREMSCSIILQSESQLKKVFSVAWPTIMAACQSYVFLGSNDLETCQNVSLRVNRPLDEILYKKYDELYVFTQGEKPRKAKRYDMKKNEQYKFINEL